jgi:hypothetical protein
MSEAVAGCPFREPCRRLGAGGVPPTGGLGSHRPRRGTRTDLNPAILQQHQRLRENLPCAPIGTFGPGAQPVRSTGVVPSSGGRGNSPENPSEMVEKVSHSRLIGPSPFDPGLTDAGEGRPHSSGIPALRRPARKLASERARMVGASIGEPDLRRAMVDQEPSPPSLRASASSAAAHSVSPLRA